ncbi:hypothetical protein IZY60_14445 [Lutibacter sp. B2]|nr:hypothetical protein [Lutibacter sp. B2]
MLDTEFKVMKVNDFIDQEEIEEIKEFSVLDKLLKKDEDKQLDFKVENKLCMGLDKGVSTEDILKDRVCQGSIYKLVLNNDYVQIWDEQGKIIGISGDDMRYHVGKNIMITKISNIKKRSLHIDGEIKIS